MRRRKWKERVIASVLASACIATSLPAAALAAEFPGHNEEPAVEVMESTALLADFTFDDAQSGFNGGQAKASGGYTLQEVDGKKAIYLNGSSANFLTVTKDDGTSLLTGKEEVTISYEAKPDRTSTNWGFYAAPNANKQTNNQERYIGALISNGNTKIERYNNSGSRPASPSARTGAGWSHIDIVLGEMNTSIYVNGVQQASLDSSSSYKLSAILGNSSIFQIGKANWGNGEYYKGWMDNFRIYDGALAESEIVKNAEAFSKSIVDADKSALILTDAPVVADLALPSEGQNGSSITWSVEDNDCIVIEGNTAKVTRRSKDTEVKFTATITCGKVSDTKVITVTVPKEYSEEQIVELAKEKLQILNADEVRGNLTLPEEVTVEGTDKKVTVTWKSDKPEVITDQEIDGKKAGVVTRQASDTSVKMTADLRCGTAKGEKNITLNVKKKYEMGKTTNYLFAHFTGSEGRVTDEQIYFATSEDGSQWQDLRENGNPVLTSDIGDRGVRDPYLIRSPEGDRFFLIATDLSINRRGGWGKAQATTTGSTKLVIWESSNLTDWTEPRLIDVAGKIPGAGCAWAPEAFYDVNTGNYVIYWATASDKSNQVGDRMNMYYCTTRDFYTFSDPVLWIDRNHSVIDTTMIYDEKTKKYYRASGDGQITIDQSDSIYEGWETIGTLSGIFNNNSYSGAKLEGPEFFKYNEDDYLKDEDGKPVETWGLMCDQYADGKGYLPFRSTNLADMTTKSWSPASDVNFGPLKKRHGTILPITDQEYRAVRKTFANIEDETGVLADFDFNSDDTGFTSENAKATGKYTLKDGLDGKALYLDGSSANYLNVTDKDGKSLLTGAEELTISYEAKPDRTDTNWVFFAAPDSRQQENKKETYLGIMVKGGTTTAERYNNTGSRPVNPSAVTGNTWVHVDVVVSKTDTVIYVNGEEQAREKSSYALNSILGSNSILLIGKANWGTGGEYYKGWIDNFRIENRALSKEEVKELSKDFVDKIPFELKKVVTGTAPDRETALNYRGTDDHTAILTKIDSEKKVITSYVRKGTDLKKLPVSFKCTQEINEITINGKTFINGTEADLSKDASVVIKAGNKTETFTMKTPVISNNPVLPGQYADPDIDYMDGKFWIFPTTDGYPSWSGTVFHAFSSEDMVNWEDEGIILDVANDNPGKNEKGIQISPSLWSEGSAWAPTIEEKDGKYYFYYCAKHQGTSSIGVAVASDPAGPYTDKGSALLTKAMCDKAGVPMGQAIDPSIFTDDDGTSYIAFGNGGAAIAELNEDMMSIKEGSLKPIKGLTDFRESVVITKKDGKYHWTWSCDDANSPNYHVNYGLTDTLFDASGNVNVKLVKKNLLVKDESKGILGSAHQSVVNITDKDGKERYFMAYHRFYTPLDIFTSADGLGKHRETCIDEIFFDENGYMTITPTLEGVAEVRVGTSEPDKADKSGLQEAVSRAKAVKTEKYTEVTVKNMNDALKAAEDLLKDESLTAEDQDQIDAAAKALNDAIDKLETKKVEDIFKDISADSWYRDSVQYVFDRDIMTGLKKNEFGPDVILARSHFATMLYRMEGEPDVTYTDRFKDVPDEAFYTEPVMWASDEEVGVINGYEDGNFGPNDNITREQMAVMLYRYAEYKGYDVKVTDDLTRFEDAAKVSPFAKNAMEWAVGAGLIKGEGDGDQLNPQGTTSRAVCATIMQRLIQQIEK